ncbi:MAG: threonine--tRNA ligase [Chlamydiae bacterium]|nr:threonine--tRNA ligase [Chlamydiota bacterium]
MKVVLNGRELQLPEGASGYDLLEKANLREPHQAVTLKINGKQADFADKIHENDDIETFDFSTPLGKETFWHTSAHIMAQAILRLCPNALATIGPPIENGFYYDFANLSLSEEDLPKIEQEMKAIVKENFKPQKHLFSDKASALARFADNPYKCELIENLPEDAPITAYEQGEFFDLCRGPHIANIGKVKAIKIMKVSGAYWRANKDNEMLTRIYGITFPDKKDLQEYLHQLEEAKKRDHRVIGQKLNLFFFSEHAAGMPFFEPAGMYIRNQLLSYWRELHKEADYQEISTPFMLDQNLWVTSGHWANYRQNMYTSQIDERQFAIKPMNCPGCMLYYKTKHHSYRELPMRVAELGIVHRHEASGAVSGLFRVRCFTQDDAHIFMKPEDIKQEILNVLYLVDKLYSPFGLSYHLELSTRPEKNTIGSDEDWEMTTNALQAALDASGKSYKVNPGDGAFYGPKIDIHIKDAIGRTWQCGTIQLDMSLPNRFELTYLDKDGIEKRPIMIHRALFGSIERFLGILIEHYAGKFPLWMNPNPIRIIPVADRHLEYAKTLQEKITKQMSLPCQIDDTHESVGKKIRTAQLDQVNYMITVGDQEVENKTITVRTRDNIVHGEQKLDSFIDQIKKEFDEKK